MLHEVDVDPAIPGHVAFPFASFVMHVRTVLVLVPAPHDTEQVFHGFQADQAMKVKVLSYTNLKT